MEYEEEELLIVRRSLYLAPKSCSSFFRNPSLYPLQRNVGSFILSKRLNIQEESLHSRLDKATFIRNVSKRACVRVCDIPIISLQANTSTSSMTPTERKRTEKKAKVAQLKQL